MAKNKDIPKDPIEKLNRFFDKNFPGSLKDKVKTQDNKVIIEMNDIEISLAAELFRRAKENHSNIYFFELEDKIVLPKENVEEIVRSIRKIFKQMQPPKPTILHSFAETREARTEAEQQSLMSTSTLTSSSTLTSTSTSSSTPSSILSPTTTDMKLDVINANILNAENEAEQRERMENYKFLEEYANVPRANLYTETQKTPQAIAKQINDELKSVEFILKDYIDVDLKTPSKGHSFLGLTTVGSDQVVKKSIAFNILEKIQNFNQLEISDPDYQRSKRALIKDLKVAIKANKEAHGFWASLAGPGKLEKILLAAQTTLEISGTPEKNRKSGIKHRTRHD